MAFVIHPRLAATCFEIGSLAGCRLLLKNNALFPWLLLVPEVAEDIVDLHQLDSQHYWEVMAALRQVSEFVSSHFGPEKLNVACLGNKVRQMHIHIVGRSAEDPAWPATVWAFEDKQPYSFEGAEAIIISAKAFLEID